MPYVADAWIDFSKTKVGYEILLNRHFYVYQPPRPLDVKKSIIQISDESGQQAIYLIDVKETKFFLPPHK